MVRQFATSVFGIRLHGQDAVVITNVHLFVPACASGALQVINDSNLELYSCWIELSETPDRTRGVLVKELSNFDMANTFGGIAGITAEDVANSVWAAIIDTGLSAADVINAINSKTTIIDGKIDTISGKIDPVDGKVVAIDIKIDNQDTGGAIMTLGQGTITP
jgi:hypothetical protein